MFRWLKGWRIDIVSPNAAPDNPDADIMRISHADPIRSVRWSSTSGPPRMPTTATDAFSHRSKRSDGTGTSN
jgi:hypothetical protein